MVKFIALALLLATPALACSPTPSRFLHGTTAKPSGFTRECGIFWKTWADSANYPGEPFHWAEMWHFDARYASPTALAATLVRAGYTYLKQEKLSDGEVPVIALYYIKDNGHLLMVQTFHALGEDYMVLGGN